MTNKTIIFSLLLTTSFAFAQVKDISVTVSPAAEYTFWDDKTGLEDGILYGGKIGFGFGEYVELRATYMKGLDLMTNFEDFGFTSFSNGLIPERDAELTRWGGEFKANFGTKTKLNPYFTLGSGVQTIQLEDFDKHEQIFATIGLGAKFNLGKRVVFALEAKNTVFNFNAGSRLLTQDDQNALGVTDADFETERLSNWSAMASLQFYLSGRRPGELSELDKAYLKTFSSGFKGLRFTIEPSLAHIDFDGDSRFRDAWLLGGYAGLDFNDYIGLRAFYFKATNDDEISTDFDNLQMYGGEFRARLNVPRGVVPYLSIGGGYLDVTNDYVGSDGLFDVNDSYFASGGLGLNVPLSKEVVAFGGVRALLTSDTDEQNLQNTDQIKTHTMYNFGIKFNIGSSSRSAKSVYQKNIEENVNDALVAQGEENSQKIAALKADYNNQIVELEEALKKANEENDVEKAVEIIEEKNEVKKALKEVEDVEKVDEKNDGVEKQKKEDLKSDYKKRIEELEKELEIANQEKDVNKAVKIIEEKNAVKKNLKEVENVDAQSFKAKSVNRYEEVTPTEEIIQMTPVEFELLISRILEKIQSPATNNATQQLNNTLKPNNNEVEVLKQRIDVLERLLLQLNAKNLDQSSSSDFSLEKIDNTDRQKDVLSMEILSKLNELNSKIERNANKIDLINDNADNTPKTIVVNPSQDKNLLDNATSLPDTTVVQDTLQRKSLLDKLHYRNTSAMLGVLIGDDTFPTASVRMHYTISDSKFEFMPELFLGVTNPLSFGLSLNGIRPLQLKQDSQIKPYIGAGLGYMKIFDTGKLNANLILGSYINLLDGKLYIDYTTRNFFKYNQLSVGYKLNF